MDNRTRIAALSLSASALVGIALHEGFRGNAYDDGVGVQTIGYGTTRNPNGTPVKKGDTITPERALVRLSAEVGGLEKELRACIGDVPMHQHEWDAIVSLAYNVGAPAVCRGSVVRNLKGQPPNYTAACESIRKYVYAGGKIFPGLVRRREAEFKKCIGGE
jgi:lysozyme